MLNSFEVLTDPAMPDPTTREREVIYAHRRYLREHSKTELVNVDPIIVYQEQHNWYRFFQRSGYATSMWYAIMVVNDITDIMGLDESVRQIYVPASATITEILNSIADD